MRSLRWRVEAAGLILVSFSLALLPCRVGDLLGLLLFHLWKERREIALANIRASSLASVENPEAVVRENFKNYGRSFMELIKVYYGLGNGILKRVTFKGLEHYETARAKGKGALFITGHCGNWELMPLACSYRLANISVVARPLDNPYLNRFLERARARFGNQVIYKAGALKGILSVLRGGGYVGVLMDQAVLADEGFIIDFLGRGAWTTKMPALIARKTGAPVLPAFIRRTNEGHEVTVYPEVALSVSVHREKALIEDTQRFSAAIERYIRENPSEWLWLHRRWKRVPEGPCPPHEKGVACQA